MFNFLFYCSCILIFLKGFNIIDISWGVASIPLAISIALVIIIWSILGLMKLSSLKSKMVDKYK